MFHGLLFIIFLVVLIVGAVFLCKMLFAEHADVPGNTAIKQAGQTPATPAELFSPQSTELYYQPPREQVYNKGNYSGLITFLLLASLGYLGYENRDLIKEKVAARLDAEAVSQPQATVSLANIGGHAVVDGVNWFKIVATSTEGIPFAGWVSENAIQKDPPKENVVADELMKKLGLPTNRERIESVKKLKNIGQSLNQALGKNDPKGI